MGAWDSNNVFIIIIIIENELKLGKSMQGIMLQQASVLPF